MEDNARKRANLLFLSIALSISPSLLNGGKRQGERKGKGRNPWPFAWFETGARCGIKAACLSFEFLISILFLRRG